MITRQTKEIPNYEKIAEATCTLIDACHGIAWNAGWHHDIVTGELLDRNFGEMLALAHSELSESLEGKRKNLMDDKLKHRKMAPVELFDAIIRIFDIIGRCYPEDWEALAEKLDYNTKRRDHTLEGRSESNGKKF